MESSQTARSTFRVLAVDDNPINMEVAYRTLLKLGYQAKAVDSGAAALKELRNHNYDAVLMDCQMPDLDGYETTRRIRQMGLNIPVIAVTANNHKEDRERAVQAGLNDYLTKPLFEQDLARVLDQHLFVPVEPSAEGAVGASLSAEAPILDLRILRQLEFLDPDRTKGVLTALLKMYEESTPDEIKKLEDLGRFGDRQAISKQAHRMKSGSSNLGLPRMVFLLQKIEHAQYEAAEFAGLIEDLLREFKIAHTKLAEFILRPGS